MNDPRIVKRALSRFQLKVNRLRLIDGTALDLGVEQIARPVHFLIIRETTIVRTRNDPHASVILPARSIASHTVIILSKR